MGKLLTALNISEDVQKTLAQNVLVAEKIIIGFQGVYTQSPESPRKEALADAISNGIFQMLEEIKNPMAQQAKWYVGKSIAELDSVIKQMRSALLIFDVGSKEYDSIVAEGREVAGYRNSIPSDTSIKIGNLEVAKKDLSTQKMNWGDAKKACEDLGGGWRLPTKDELNLLYQNKAKIGGFSGGYYWSSTENNNNYAWKQSFRSGEQNYSYNYENYGYYVRAVRV